MVENSKISSKSGQVTIFIIVGVLIIAVGILLYFFSDKLNFGGGFNEEDPAGSLQSCLSTNIEKDLETLSKQGGSLNPEHFFLYGGDEVEYLCYTKEYYKPCIMQQPMLKEHIEKEISSDIQQQVDICFDELVKNYQSAGYDVNLERGDVNIELLPKVIRVSFTHTLTLEKETKRVFGGESPANQISIEMNNNLYELVTIANSILNWEARYGDAETTAYMMLYHYIKVEKKIQTDGTTVYIITNRNTGESFKFASRSVAWPPGYGINSISVPSQ